MIFYRHLLLIWLSLVGASVLANPIPPLQLTPETCLSAINEAEKQHKNTRPKTINLLSWNIHKLKNPAAVGEIMAYSLESNILFLQEAVENKQLLAIKPFSSFAMGYQTQEFNSGVLTLSDYPMVVRCSYLHKEPWLRTPKATKIILLDVDGTLLLTANIHSINFTLRTKIFEEQLSAIQKILFAFDGPVVFGGDFNTWSERRLKALTRITNSANLMEVEFREGMRKQVFGSSLDRFFIRDIKIIKSRSRETIASDHNPIFVTLELNPLCGRLCRTSGGGS